MTEEVVADSVFAHLDIIIAYDAYARINLNMHKTIEFNHNNIDLPFSLVTCSKDQALGPTI